jgi:hypothetical protein
MPEHTAPDRFCACGIYGAFAPWDLEINEPHPHWRIIAGRVEGWGRVAMGQKGFRAESARPLELFAEPWWDDTIRRAAVRVARAYGIHLVTWETSLPAEGAVSV